MSQVTGNHGTPVGTLLNHGGERESVSTGNQDFLVSRWKRALAACGTQILRSSKPLSLRPRGPNRLEELANTGSSTFRFVFAPLSESPTSRRE